jgi:hypothetical protein
MSPREAQAMFIKEKEDEAEEMTKRADDLCPAHHTCLWLNIERLLLALLRCR